MTDDNTARMDAETFGRIISNNKLKYTEIDGRMIAKGKLGVKIVENFEDKVMDEVFRQMEVAGITDMVAINRQFVGDAIREKLSCHPAKDMEQTTAQLRVRERELLEERARHHWISVKDRLPESLELNSRGERCCLSEIVLTYRIHPSGATWVEQDRYNSAGNWLGEAEQDGLWKVTHWMPLPEPPEEDMA